MQLFWAILVILSVMIFISPWIVSYIIATFLLLVGLQLLGVSSWLKSSSKGDNAPGKSFRVGEYEILKRKK